LAFLQKRILTAILATLWLVGVPAGLRSLLIYENKPGTVGTVPQTWPSQQIQPAKDRPTLVMLAHPRCPCTQASIGELEKLMARLQGKVAAYVLFVKPRSTESVWEDTTLRRKAEAIPGVKVALDFDGVEARRFGSETSGHTFLFGTDGRLLFNGGITASRGHAGDNAGESAIIALLNNEVPSRNQTVVFGCALTNNTQTERAALCSK
jgi:hypothetical protein